MRVKLIECLIIGLVAAMASPAGATVTMLANSDSSLILNGQTVASDQAAPGLTASTSLNKKFPGNGGPGDPGVGNASALTSASILTGQVTSRVDVTNYQPGAFVPDGRVESKGNSSLSYGFVNDGTSAVHAYLDFFLPSLLLETDYMRPAADPRQSFAEASLLANASLNGQSLLSNVLLYRGALTETGAGPSFAETFDPLLIGTGSTLACSGMVGVGQGCSGSVMGTLDLGLVDVGDTLSLDYMLNTSVFADSVTNAIFGSGTAWAQDCQPDTECRPTTLRLAAAETVPEPATWLSMVAGFGLLGGAWRRRLVAPRTA